MLIKTFRVLALGKQPIDIMAERFEVVPVHWFSKKVILQLYCENRIVAAFQDWDCIVDAIQVPRLP